MLQDVAQILWVLCIFVFGFTHAFFVIACADVRSRSAAIPAHRR